MRFEINFFNREDKYVTLSVPVTDEYGKQRTQKDQGSIRPRDESPANPSDAVRIESP